MEPVLWSPRCSDSVPVVGGGIGAGGEASSGGQKQEAVAAMAAVVPAISGEGGGLGEHKRREAEPKMAAAEARAAWSGGAPCGCRRPNRAVAAISGAGGVPATNWRRKESGKGVIGMEIPFLPSISEDLRCMRRISELR
uniref:Uncharacterized protein n=1 Tax=Oryza meridionalis TaxID=40149 RepID=A0A0E0CP57_9ORYZ